MVKRGKRPHRPIPLSDDRPLSETHVKRLWGKFSIIQYRGNILANPDKKPNDATKLDAWPFSRLMGKMGTVFFLKKMGT